jgi:hypothetical protein
MGVFTDGKNAGKKFADEGKKSFPAGKNLGNEQYEKGKKKSS